MSTDRISPSSSLVEALRTIARERTRETGKSVSTGGAGSNENAAPVEAKHQAAALRQRLRDLVAGVDSKDPESIAQVRDTALREILLWEFGSDFRKDSQFLPMVDAIGKTLDTDPRFGQRFAELIADLQKA
ncbi:MAG: hypothetical protein WA777_06180 [Rhodanobacter sp.]